MMKCFIKMIETCVIPFLLAGTVRICSEFVSVITNKASIRDDNLKLISMCGLW